MWYVFYLHPCHAVHVYNIQRKLWLVCLSCNRWRRVRVIPHAARLRGWLDISRPVRQRLQATTLIMQDKRYRGYPCNKANLSYLKYHQSTFKSLASIYPHTHHQHWEVTKNHWSLTTDDLTIASEICSHQSPLFYIFIHLHTRRVTAIFYSIMSNSQENPQLRLLYIIICQHIFRFIVVFHDEMSNSNQNFSKAPMHRNKPNITYLLTSQRPKVLCIHRWGKMFIDHKAFHAWTRLISRAFFARRSYIARCDRETFWCVEM